MSQYYPILISKEGEIDALQRLEQKVKEATSPLIDLIPNGLDLAQVSKKIKAHWNFDNNRLLLEYSRFANEADLKDVLGLFQSLRAWGVNVIPTIGLASTPLQKQLSKNILAKKKGLAVRIAMSDRPYMQLNKELDGLLNEMGTKSSDVSLLLDFGFIQENSAQIISSTAIKTIDTLTKSRDWKNIVFIGGSFPKDLAELEASPEPYYLNRQEEVIFSSINSDRKDVQFGDYGTKHPNYVPSGEHQASCSIKYSTLKHFIIFRGKLAANHALGNGQYIEHCKRLIKMDDFAGEGFSWGDHEILRISKEKTEHPQARTGNPKTWVTISWSHHMTFINKLASNQPDF